MKSTLAVVVVLCGAMLLVAPDVQACYSDTASTGWSGALNDDLNDFAMIFMDSHPNAVTCKATAASRLYTKLSAMPDSAFDDWLVGGSVQLAMAAAMQLGPSGLVSKELDAQLARAGRLYTMSLDTVNGGCGFDGFASDGSPRWTKGNTCQEDRLVGAAAYAWIGAYYRKSGRPWTGKKDAAVYQIQQAFSNGDSICRHNSAGSFTGSRGPCNGGNTDPVISINHGAQSPAYGLGQITSMSVALIGFDAMDYPWNNGWLDTAQQNALTQMWTEGKNSANATTGVFNSTCFDVLYPWQETANVPCNDYHFGGAYEAYRFPVWYAFERYNLPGRSAGGYQWQLSNGTYDLPDRTDFFGAGRYTYYHILTKAYNDPYEPDPYGWPRPAAFHGGSDYYMGATVDVNGLWVAAENNGGSTLSANRTSQGPWESFYLNDINGGELNNGDTVSIRTTSGWYWSAVNGGGSYLYCNQTSAITWEVFTVQKRGGSSGSRIEDGDTYALKAYNGTSYVNASYAGTMAANGNIVSAAVFTFHHVADY